VLQEATAVAGHPSYRRYHYGEGPLLVEDGGVRRFISTDALGSTTDLTGADATVASMRKYDAWGQYRNETAPSASQPKLGFTGHQYDPETGLVYARARYYDPDLGRFLSRDSYEGTLGEAPSLHRYTYAHDNPLTYVDEDGHAVNLATAGVGALIGGVGGCLVGAWSGGWEGCGKGALVGAGAGAMAGLTFGASLAATGAVGVGGTAVASGGTTGSVLVAGTMASAVGGASSGAGNVLINGGSGAEALEAAENTAFLAAVGGAVGSAVAPAIGGAVVQSTGSQTLGKVAAGVAGAVVGDTAAQATAISGGVQERFSGNRWQSLLRSALEARCCRMASSRHEPERLRLPRSWSKPGMRLRPSRLRRRR
jgi:RHS repeat-associated protein